MIIKGGWLNNLKNGNAMVFINNEINYKGYRLNSVLKNKIKIYQRII